MPDNRDHNKKVKTKAAMLQELESIKGLLLENDEIPILQEIIEPTASQPPLSSQALHQLQDEFQALSQAMDGKATEKNSTSSLPQSKPASTAASLLDAFTRTPQHKALPAETRQPSLFQESQTELPSDFLKDEVAIQSESHIIPPGGAEKYSHQRQPLAKAQGENPFLPQHIRARLHGNNPLPSFDLSRPQTNTNPGTIHSNPDTIYSNSGTSHSPHKSLTHDEPKAPSEPETRHQLVDALVEATLPRLEQELRNKLNTMSQETLKRLLNQD